MAHNLVFHVCSKHIEIDYHFVREQIVAKTLDVWYVLGLDQVADALTKAMFDDRFLHLKTSFVLLPSHFACREL